LIDTASRPDTVAERDWMRLLAKYREPDETRSIVEIAITLLPFVALWVLAWVSLSVGYWLAVVFIVPAALMLVRLFLIQHDCGHGAFFRRRAANDWVGRALGVLTFTPYDVWRRSHAIHHAGSGHLDHRGFGDITTLTVREYRARPWWRRLAYRIYRQPLVMLGIGPAFVFLIQQRLPFGHMRGGIAMWASAMGTNAGIAAFAGGLIWLIGLAPFLLVQLPIVMLAASIGIWLFYVQHQFEDTYWAEAGEWKLQDAALLGSSYYDLPPVLRWFTANIGVHHVHHLYSKIPFYRLQQVMRDFPELAGFRRLTLLESFGCLRLRLWDEQKRRLVSFRDASLR
jgi:omega-6 fatty acid desaturase (delta-12 desaturase)